MKGQNLNLEIKPLNSEPVVKKIFDTFCDLIFSGQLKPGDKIPTEKELAEKFGAGRNSIREAKKMLTAVGVFKEVRGLGTFVEDRVTPSVFNPLLFSMLLESKNSDDVYELRVMFACAAIRLAMEKATDEEIQKVKEVLNESMELYDKGVRDTDVFINLDIDLHNRIYGLTKNPLIERIASVISELFRPFMNKSLKQPKGIERSIRNHSQIIELLMNRDTKHIKDVIELTLAEWKEKWS